MPDFASVTIVTPALGLLLTTCVLMAAPAKEEDPAARAQATLQRVSKLPLEHQRIWLRLIEQRYGWAVLLTLKPEEPSASRPEWRRSCAKRPSPGTSCRACCGNWISARRRPSPASCGNTVREVYETFRKQPRDMVDRQEAWYRIWSLWEKAGSPPEQQDRLMDWLADAIKASAKDSIGPLPPDPKFGDEVELVPEQLVKQLTQPPAARPRSKPSGPSRPRPGSRPTSPARSGVAGPLRRCRCGFPIRVERSSGEAAARGSRGPARREHRVRCPCCAEAPPAVVPPLHILPPIAADDPKELTTPPEPPHHSPGGGRPTEALTAAGEFRGSGRRSRARRRETASIGPRRQPAEPPPRTVEPALPEQPLPSWRRSPSAPLAKVLAGRNSAATEAGLPSGSVSRHDVAAAIAARTGEVHRAAAAAAGGIPGGTQTASGRMERPSTQPPSPPAAPADQHAQVNVEELGTRIEGINLSLRNLEAELNGNTTSPPINWTPCSAAWTSSCCGKRT